MSGKIVYQNEFIEPDEAGQEAWPQDEDPRNRRVQAGSKVAVHSGMAAVILAGALVCGLGITRQDSPDEEPPVAFIEPENADEVLDRRELPVTEPTKAAPLYPNIYTRDFVSIPSENLYVGSTGGGVKYELVLPQAYVTYPLDENYFGELEALLNLINFKLEPATRLYMSGATVHVEYSVEVTEDSYKLVPYMLNLPASLPTYYGYRHLPIPFEEFYLESHEINKNVLMSFVNLAEVIELQKGVDTERTKAIIRAITFAVGNSPYELYIKNFPQDAELFSPEDYSVLVDHLASLPK